MSATEFDPFHPPPWLAGGHRQTLWTTLARPAPEVAYEREQLELPDGDFLDLAWARAGAAHARDEDAASETAAPHLAILSHGLEGNVDRPYMRGMARRFNAAGWDVLAWNMRGCGPQPNRLPRPYHSGATEDLHAVVTHGLNRGNHGSGYRSILLVGFSLGANLTLLYLGREREIVPSAVVGAVAFSAPVDLRAAARHIERPANWLYELRFLRSLHRRARALAERHPTALDPAVLRHATTIFRYDDHVTAPLAGFAGALDYYTRSSSLPQLARIDRPTLLLSAADDPFLPAACYPRRTVDPLPHVTLEIPDRGGHVGFLARGDGDGRTHGYWSERRAVAFAREVVE